MCNSLAERARKLGYSLWQAPNANTLPAIGQAFSSRLYNRFNIGLNWLFVCLVRKYSNKKKQEEEPHDLTLNCNLRWRKCTFGLHFLVFKRGSSLLPPTFLFDCRRSNGPPKASHPRCPRANFVIGGSPRIMCPPPLYERRAGWKIPRQDLVPDKTDRCKSLHPA